MAALGYKGNEVQYVCFSLSSCFLGANIKYR
jgi:hypothetical protein